MKGYEPSCTFYQEFSPSSHQQGLPTPLPGEPKGDLGRYLVAVLVGAQKLQGLWEERSEQWQVHTSLVMPFPSLPRPQLALRPFQKG